MMHCEETLSQKALPLNPTEKLSWSICEGDRGLPITNETVYTNPGENPHIRRINLNKYKSGRVLLEVLCATNEVAQDMQEIFAPQLKKIELYRLYSQLTFESPYPTKESMDELRKQVQMLGQEHSIPKEIVEHIDSQIEHITNVYSQFRFYSMAKEKSHTELDKAPNSALDL